MKRRDFIKNATISSASLAITGKVYASTQKTSSECYLGNGIRFRKDGTLKIVQFTDTHWTQKEPSHDAETHKVMETVLDIEKPDFVVFTGDNVWGKTCNGANDIKKLLKPIIDRKIEWAWTLGNHDDEGVTSRKELMKIAIDQPFSKCQIGPENITGESNYIIPIHSFNGSRQAATLYMMDTNAYVPKHLKTAVGGYDWINKDQIDWFLDTAKKIRTKNNEKILPALSFFHIPIPEYEQVWWANLADGERKEWPGNPNVNSGFFLAMLQAGDVMGTFVGHAHLNDYEGNLFGIRLCCGKGTGKAAYGSEFPRGGRVITLEQDKRDFESWIRLENKQKLQWKKEVKPEQS